MRVLVCGGRDYADQQAVDAVLRTVSEHAVIVHGAARGADSLAANFADATGRKVEAYPADWDQYGKAAGAIRNKQMLDTGIDVVIAFPGGRGTAHMKGIAREAGVPVLEVT